MSESGAGKGGCNGHAEDSSRRHPDPGPGALPGWAAHWACPGAAWGRLCVARVRTGCSTTAAREVVVGSAPLPGRHTAEILTSLLHHTPEEVQKLESEGAVYDSP